MAASDEAAPRQGTVFLPSHCDNKSYKPGSVVITCADFGSRVRHLEWSVWNRTTAVGFGFNLSKDCTPAYNCHSYRSVPARIVASRPRYCLNVGHNSFTRVRVNILGSTEGLKHFTEFYPCAILHR